MWGARAGHPFAGCRILIDYVVSWLPIHTCFRLLFVFVVSCMSEAYRFIHLKVTLGRDISATCRKCGRLYGVRLSDEWRPPISGPTGCKVHGAGLSAHSVGVTPQHLFVRVSRR